MAQSYLASALEAPEARAKAPFSALPSGSSSEFQSDSHGTIYLDRIKIDLCENHDAHQREPMPSFHLRAAAIYKDTFVTIDNNVQRLGWGM